MLLFFLSNAVQRGCGRTAGKREADFSNLLAAALRSEEYVYVHGIEKMLNQRAENVVSKLR